MADFPDSIFEGREIENVPGVVYDETKTTRIYAEDVQKIFDEITAIETILGTDPQGAFDTVKAWLEDLAAGGGGTIWYAGSGVPDDSVGNDGDFYFRTSNGAVYEKASGTWGSPIANLTGPAGSNGTNGTNGTNGATWRTGTGAPSSGLGVDGDLYFRTDTDDVYLKSAGSYSVIANIKGSTGATGATGATGPAGPAFDSRVRAHIGSAQSINDNTDTLLDFSVEDFDGLNEWNTSTKKFTAQAAGTYRFNVALYFNQDMGANHGKYLFVYKNTSTQVSAMADTTTGGSTARENLQLSDSVVLAANDTLEFHVQHTQGSARTIGNDNTACFVNIERVK